MLKFSEAIQSLQSVFRQQKLESLLDHIADIGAKGRGQKMRKSMGKRVSLVLNNYYNVQFLGPSEIPPCESSVEAP